MSFNAGPHLDTHQHYDAGNLTIFRGVDLAVDSGSTRRLRIEALVQLLRAHRRAQHDHDHRPERAVGGHLGRSARQSRRERRGPAHRGAAHAGADPRRIPGEPRRLRPGANRTLRRGPLGRVRPREPDQRVPEPRVSVDAAERVPQPAEGVSCRPRARVPARRRPARRVRRLRSCRLHGRRASRRRSSGTRASRSNPRTGRCAWTRGKRDTRAAGSTTSNRS